MLGQREKDREQYEAYELGVLADFVGVYGPNQMPHRQHVPSSPPSQSEHANTLREEFKEYCAEAMDAFELSVSIGGELHRLHPPPGVGEQQRLAALDWDKRTVAELAAPGIPPNSVARLEMPTIEIVATSKVDARLARHYLSRANLGSRESIDGWQFLSGTGTLPGQFAHSLGRTKQRPLLSRCLYARALCMMMEADAATSVRARREQLKRDSGLHEEQLKALCFSDLGSAELCEYFGATSNTL